MPSSREAIVCTQLVCLDGKKVAHTMNAFGVAQLRTYYINTPRIHVDCFWQVTTVTVGRTLSVDKSRVDFGQLSIGSKAEVNMPHSAVYSRHITLKRYRQ